MKIKTQFLFSSILVISVIILFFGGSTFLGNYLETKFEERDDITDEGLEVIADLKIQIRDQVSHLKNYIILDTRESEWRDYQNHQGEVIKSLEKLDFVLEDTESFSDLQDSYSALSIVANQLKSEFIRQEDIQIIIRSINQHQSEINDILRKISDTLSEQEEKNDQYIENLTFWLVVLRYSGVIIAVLIVFWELKNTFVPIGLSIQELTLKVKDIGSGKLDQRVNIRTGDEIEILANEFNAMASQLQDYYSSLEQKVNERTAELTQTNITLKETLIELKQAQSQLIHNEKMSSLGQLVAGIAHEINNPASFIFGNLTHVSEYMDDLLEVIQCYEQHYPDPHPEVKELQDELDMDFMKKDLSKAMNSMQSGVKRIREIILSLRTFSRLDEAEQKEADIHEGIDSTLMILQHRLQEQDNRPEIQVNKDYGEIPLIMCYHGQLNQVVMNILVNAIDALEDSYSTADNEGQPASNLKINIQTAQVANPTLNHEDNDPWLEIIIADNGPGIEAGVFNQIFDPFFTTKTVGQGTGLGLSICYQIIVDKHRGQLHCESEPGAGAKFMIRLPIAPCT